MLHIIAFGSINKQVREYRSGEEATDRKRFLNFFSICSLKRDQKYVRHSPIAGSSG
jgi:hypothetical protein